MSISIDSKERKTIIESDQSFIVSAPAGSGKTEVLVARMLKKLLIVDDAKEIIAITFTKKAANEIIGICLSNGMVLNSAIEGSDSWYSNKKDSPLPRMMRSLFTFNEFDRLIPTYVNRRFIYILQKN